MKNISSYCLLLLILYFGGCAAHTNLTPAGKGNLFLNAGAGGPFIPLFDTKIPTPYLTIGGYYGLTDKMNADANLHITPLFYRVAGLDMGTAWFPVLNNGWQPTWGIQPRILFLASTKNDVDSRFRIYPFLTNSAAWSVGPGHAFTGLDLIVPLTRPDYDKEAAHIIVSPFGGYRLNVSNKTRLLGQVKLQGTNIESSHLAVEYISVANRGAFSVMFTVERRF